MEELDADPHNLKDEAIVISVGSSALNEARAQYFGFGYASEVNTNDPNLWPYYRIPVSTELEGAVVRAIAPERSRVEIVRL